MKRLLQLFTLATMIAGFTWTALPAHAATSIDPTPYTVTAEGVTLPDGVVFPADGHVNWRTTIKSGGIHFDPFNGQPGGAYIGQSSLPIPLEPGECIVWVQVSLYNEHFGEGGQNPVCAPEEVVPVEPEPTDPGIEPEPDATGSEPEPSDPDTPTESPHPEPSEKPALPLDPTPTPTVSPEPSPEVPVDPVPSVTETSTPPASQEPESDDPVSGPEPVPSVEPTPTASVQSESAPTVEVGVPDSVELAQTGDNLNAVLAAAALIGVGVIVVIIGRYLRN